MEASHLFKFSNFEFSIAVDGKVSIQASQLGRAGVLRHLARGKVSIQPRLCERLNQTSEMAGIRSRCCIDVYWPGRIGRVMK